jgi:CheY-like chemotaxis protein
MKSGSSRRVLVVDDDDDLRETIAQVLADEGWHVDGSPDGRAALSKLHGLQAKAQPLPDLILLDLMMPVMNGQQFRVEQLGDPHLACIPVILMTAGRNGSDIDGDEGLPRLRKPFSVEELLGALGATAPGALR